MTTIPPEEAFELPPGIQAVVDMVAEVSARAAPHAVRHDREASFTTEGYEAVRDTGYGTIAVPEELGGGGHDLATVCQAQATLARACANTALGIAMHQHNVLSLAWRFRLGDPAVEHTLRRVADGLIISSSGSADRWNPGVTATRAVGGLRVTGLKQYCSGAPSADVVATLAILEGAGEPRPVSVLVPTSDPGFEVVPDWDAMGMRGSGSNPVRFSDVLVPHENVLDLRFMQRRHMARVETGMFRSVPGTRTDSSRIPGLHMALTVIAAVYLGAAEGVHDQALEMVAAGPGADDPSRQRLAGLLTLEGRSARWALEALVAATTDEALGTEEHFVTTMLAKRQIILSSIRMVELGMELLGTRTYLRNMPFEQALRDVRAGITHPLAPERTLIEVGRSVLAALAEE